MKHNCNTFLIFLALLCVPITASAKRQAELHKAKLISFGMNHWISSSGTQTNGHVDNNGNYSGTTTSSDWGHNTYRIVLDDGKITYFAERTLSFRWQHDPQFTENATIRFTLDGDKLIVLDDTGKEFKMKLIKRRIND